MSMDRRKIMFLVNATLTLPVGIFALFFPLITFSVLGISLAEGSAVIARLYGLTLISYGLIFAFFQNSKDSTTVRSIFISAAVFQLLLALVLGMAAAQGSVSSVAWWLLILHTLVAVLCAYSYLSE
jgi:hypothetical protein